MTYAQKAGSNLDNDLANAIDGATGDLVRAHSMRGSGNTLYAAPDLLVRTPTVDHAIEAKRRSAPSRGERCTVMDESQEGDVSELLANRNSYTSVWLALKFPNCQLCVVEAVAGDDDARAFAEALPAAFDANATDTGNLTARKPATDDWPSARAGADDVDVLLDALGLRDYATE